MNHPLTIGKYAITGVLGEGAMGVVYRAHDPVIQRPVAIKTIHRHLAPSADDSEGASLAARFRNEARAVGRLSHPGIVAIYEYGEDDGTAFIAMEFVPGQSLAQRLAATPLLPEAEVLRLMDALLDALSFAHAQGVWHRDVKPANLLITPGGQLKITDFGIARIENAALTQVASSIGTPGYMAPEQYLGEGVDHRADIFAAGVLLYRLLTGQAPFAGAPESVMYKIFNETPMPPSQVQGTNRGAGYDDIVACALARDMSARYASADAFRRALALRRDRASPTGIVDDDATVINGARASRAVDADPPAGRDPSWLGDLERTLIDSIGPVARLLVREAARESPDNASVVQRLARQIPEERARDAFVARFAPAMPAMPASTGAPAAAAVDDDLLARVVSLLTRHIGPIAQVVVKKAAARAQDRAQLLALVVESVDAGPDRVKLDEALRALR